MPKNYLLGKLPFAFTISRGQLLIVGKKKYFFLNAVPVHTGMVFLKQHSRHSRITKLMIMKEF
jgi:hypothetical protein